jgi:hypothetical protein
MSWLTFHNIGTVVNKGLVDTEVNRHLLPLHRQKGIGISM